MGKPTPTFKVKIWTLGYADSLFSHFIRKRDGKCMRCLRTGMPLDCSHYWRRDMWGSRFDPNNCVALCRDCHTTWERHQNPAYKAFMLSWLRKPAYESLERRARAFKGRRNAIVDAMSFLKGG